MNFLVVSQLIISVFLILAVLLQNRGSGLSSAFGGGGGEGFHTKRGLEKFLFTATIVLGTLFILNAIGFLIF